MDGVNLREALERIEISGVRERAEGVADLKHILRHHQRTSRIEQLSDVSLHHIFEILFRVVIADQSAYVKAKPGTLKTAAANRLGSYAGALRLAVEIGVTSIRLKTVRALVDHILQSLYLANGNICEPLATDYAKCLRTVLSYQPHVEHLSRAEWERIASFCIDNIGSSEPGISGDDAASGAVVSTQRATPSRVSYRSSHSHAPTTASSQGPGGLNRQIAEEMAAIARMITAAPNAPLAGKPTDDRTPRLFWVMVGYLKSGSASTRAQQDAFATINNLLLWTRSENIALTKQATVHMLRLARVYWNTKATGLKDEILITILNLKLYIRHLSQGTGAAALRAEVSNLQGVIAAEYTQRKDRELLHMDDLYMCLQRTSGPDREIGAVSNALMSLRCVGARAEHSWLLVSTMAFLVETAIDDPADDNSSDEYDEEDAMQRPRKKQRMTSEFEDLFDSSRHGSQQTRTTALQIITFLAQQTSLSPDIMTKALDAVLFSCSDDNATTASWALLAAASCALQIRSSDQSLATRWNSLWQLASRSLSSATHCRAASHLLQCMMHLGLVAQGMAVELLQSLTVAIELSGPSTISDSALQFFRTTMELAPSLVPATAHAVADSIIGWMLRRWTPSKFDDRTYAAQCNLHRYPDILSLISCYLGQSSRLPFAPGFRVWDSLAVTYIRTQSTEPLVSYLLALPPQQTTMHPRLAQALSGSSSELSQAASKPASQTLILTHVENELSRANIGWSSLIHDRPRSVSTDVFAALCMSVAVSAKLLDSCLFLDKRLQSRVWGHCRTLLDSLSTYVSSPECDQDKIDIMLVSFANVVGFSNWSDSENDNEQLPQRPNDCQVSLCRTINDALVTKSSHQGSNGSIDEDDMMDTGPSHESQDSKHGNSGVSNVELTDEHTVTYSTAALRASVPLYASIVVAVASSEDEPTGTELRSSAIIDKVVELPETSVVAGRAVLASLPQLLADMTATDTDRLLDHLTEKILNAYAFERSEVAIGTIIDVMASLKAFWTDPVNKNLFDLGLDMYAWCTSTALKAGVLSPNVQKKLGDLLLQLCHINTEYGRDDEVPSVRTSLFQLVQLGALSVQHYLAQRISTIFGLFVLSAHEPMFDDLQASLSSDITWIEGFAIRLLFLARLASSWHSLLRRSVYYIFEAPGSVPATMPYATFCIEEVARSLHYKTPQTLFSLFAPQLLYSWLEQYKLANLPYAVFGYKTLREFVEHNKIELAAQLHLRSAKDGMRLLQNTLETNEQSVLHQAFGKSLAYAIASDISQRLTPDQGLNCEGRLRVAVGGKEELTKLASAQFPSIMGQFYLCLNQEHTDDKWMEKHAIDSQAALAEMKAYSHSIRPMPHSQEPCFKAARLGAQIDRLCRRSGHESSAPWDPSSFTVAARMLLDSVDDALGSLHVCTMLRKLRILIADAGNVAITGYPLEMLLRSIQPLLSDSECADDIIGILRYLLQHGKQYLSGNLSFLCGITCILMLQMRKHMSSGHNSTTQESQHQSTIAKMREFCTWLTEALRHLQDAVDTRSKNDYGIFVDAITHVQLPGNARKGSAESELILLLVHQQKNSQPLFQLRDIMEALTMLSKNFQTPSTATEDTLSDDDRCIEYVPYLWLASRTVTFDDSFTLWISHAAGRAYAATGNQDLLLVENDKSRHDKVLRQFHGSQRSQALIASRLCDILASSSRMEAGLAEYTLQLAASNQSAEVEPNVMIAFEQSLPEVVSSALGRGTYGYTPPAASMVQLHQRNLEALRCASALDNSRDLNAWAKELTMVLCQWPTTSPLVGALPAILQALPHLALEWLPCVLHMVLDFEIDRDQTVKATVSDAMTEHLEAESVVHVPKQRYLLDLLLYLRQQPYQRETTKVDRSRWLDLDHMLAAKVASRCEMPTLSLMFAETAPSREQPNRRASSRASLPSATPTSIPDDLLLRIFEQVDEPDSFYGVTQPASLAAVLSRLDYENSGFKGLMFRSAQVDNNMRRLNKLDDADRLGMVKSLSMLNLNSLTFALTAGGLAGAVGSNDEMLDSARKLQQWDIALPQSDSNTASRLVQVFQVLNSTPERLHALETVQRLMLAHVEPNPGNASLHIKDTRWFNTLGVLAELQELINNTGQGEVEVVTSKMQARQEWMTKARFEDIETLQQSRQIIFSVLARNEDLLRALHTEPKALRAAEAQFLLSFSTMARKHGQLQHALSAATQASDLEQELGKIGLSIDAAARHEIASVLWESGEHAVSVNVLRDILKGSNLEMQTIPVGRSGLLAQLGQQLADARLEKPADILESYLKPAISQISGQRQGREAGKVFYAFAEFCDQQLQHPANIEDFKRITILRQRKLDEVEGLADLIKGMRKGSERNDNQRSHNKAESWFKLDDAEYQKQKKSRELFMQQSLQNYMLALQACDEHDICVLRLFALWLENADAAQANEIANKYLPRIPSWKFVVLLNQLMSRLKGDDSRFQTALGALTLRMATEHPYHCVHHVYASTLKPASSDEAANSRYAAASKIRNQVASDRNRHDLFQRLLQADEYYRLLAEEELGGKIGKSASISHIKTAARVGKKIPELRLPPVTMSVSLRPDGDYRGLPYVHKFGPVVRIMSGLSTPKVLTAVASNGRHYDQLFKSGNDDLRQDAIMEQVFDEVSKMLQNHKATRQRKLHIRTYKVIPTSNTSGIIEFVPNSIPIGDWLTPAHSKYYPKDVKVNTARNAIKSVDQQGPENRVKEFRKVCDHLHPVLRHFFLERFDDPDDWFEKRTAYTRTTASVSILGHVLGLGDRHCSNIMLDEKTGEVVHIDLGVAFEAGRILPIPELVPFRLTRDIVDGMGITKTEGIFRRCCEFTMDALREDKDSIMTLLNVLRYDPLYTWTLSPLRAKRMQDASDGGHNANDVEAVENSKKKEQEAGEADRALAIVEKKLSKTLSTAATVNELIQQATDETNLATLFAGWMAYL